LFVLFMLCQAKWATGGDRSAAVVWQAELVLVVAGAVILPVSVAGFMWACWNVRGTTAAHLWVVCTAMNAIMLFLGLSRSSR
jgi:hypothetical protein